MRVLVVVFLVSLCACASAPPPPKVGDLLHDELFPPPAQPIDPAAAMAVSAEMKQYLASRIPAIMRHSERKRMLLDALYRKEDLRIEYDAATTRTAAQAFEARQGNCLALVMMTGALANELGLSVRYQEVIGVDEPERVGNLYLSIGHVNLTLDDRTRPIGVVGIQIDDSLTVDFTPPRSGQGFRTRPIREQTVVAMYLNNRAVETLMTGDVMGAYWWARQALMEDPQFMRAYLTLGVVYRKRGRADLADPVLAEVLAREPENIKALTNRLLVLRDLGRDAEALALQQQLERLDPHPAFSYLREGIEAMNQGHFETARQLFAREAARAPHNHEVQYWLAAASLALHDGERARAHLERAMEFSTTRRDRDLYAAKLERLNALHLQ